LSSSDAPRPSLVLSGFAKLVPQDSKPEPRCTDLTFLSGLSPIIWISATCPQLMDDLIQSRDFRVFDTPMTEILCQLKTPVADIPMGRSISRHVSPQTDGSDFLGTISRLEIPDLLSSRLRYPERPISR
jgi:hypothetical protein